MNLWHLTPDTPRLPARARARQHVRLCAGTWPIEPGQSVWVTWRVDHADTTSEEGRAEAVWEHNAGTNSYWQAEIGPFARGDHVRYTLAGRSPDGPTQTPPADFVVAPPLHLALVWHQHQPVYRDAARRRARGSYLRPWVRLHALRDYYSMAALMGEHSAVHVTINLTPALLSQIEDYVERGATDRALDLTLKPAETLTAAEREEILSGFFDADWHNQIFPHARYKELFTQRMEGRRFSVQDLRDLQMWSNLSWFGQEFRDGDVALATGDRVSARSFVERGRGFDAADLHEMVRLQYRIMGAIVPLHRALEARGQIELTTTPFYHPILPLLVDTDRAVIDREGATLPRRFAYPQDAAAQVCEAVAHHHRCFGRAPTGMWPAEGAVSQSVIPMVARHGIRWIATDAGVLARSGRWGYRADDPDVLCQPYRATEDGHDVAVLFRDTRLSDAIGFHYQRYDDYEAAARDFMREIKDRFASRVSTEADRILTVVLDGENAWGAYRQDARPFLRALYALLGEDPDILTVTPREYLDGNPGRGVAAHPLPELVRVHDLFTGSWIDEAGSAPGVDLGTWIGEGEENRAWELLLDAREFVDHDAARPRTAAALRALYIAEGSDWFWWLGSDQSSGNDTEFDDLFRRHLRSVYRAMGAAPPAALDRHIVPHAPVWTFTRPVGTVQAGDALLVRTNCPGRLEWAFDGEPPHSTPLVPAGGAMAGLHRYDVTLGPFASAPAKLRFRFYCAHRRCDCREACCRGDEQVVRVVQA